MRVSVWQRSSILSAALLLGIGCALAGSGGCAQHDDSTDMTMPSDKLKAITAADAVISKGQKEIDRGQELKDKDPDQAAALIKQGETDKAHGQDLLNQAYMMK